jgi:hypothetical protein
MKIRPDILTFLNAHRRIWLEKRLGWVRLGWVSDVHAQVIMLLALSSFHLTTSDNSHVGITECFQLKSVSLKKAPMAQHLYQISWNSIQPFSSSWNRTDGRHG